jgi:hypothetical protein
VTKDSVNITCAHINVFLHILSNSTLIVYCGRKCSILHCFTLHFSFQEHNSECWVRADCIQSDIWNTVFCIGAQFCLHSCVITQVVQSILCGSGTPSHPRWPESSKWQHLLIMCCKSTTTAAAVTYVHAYAHVLHMVYQQGNTELQ